MGNPRGHGSSLAMGMVATAVVGAQFQIFQSMSIFSGSFVFFTTDTLYPYESFMLQDMKQSVYFEQTENLGLRLTCEKCD